MHRFFTDKSPVKAGKVRITGSVSRQISNVLRLKPGEKITVLDNTGKEYDVTLEEVSRRQTSGKVTDSRQCLSEPHPKITLFQALTGRDKFEHILQKCTEVGVTRFVPLVTQRSIVHSGNKITEEKLARRRTIIKEAAEQSGRAIIPQLESPLPLADTIDYPGSFDLILVGSTEIATLTNQNQHGLKLILQNTSSSQPVNIALFIGPEGGFSNDEMQLLKSKGAVAFSLGRRILRTETAAVVASAIILYELENQSSF